MLPRWPTGLLRFLPLLLLVATACNGTDSVRPDPGGTPRAPTCPGGPGGRGPKMVAITLPGITPFCIDTTEVTQTQYVEFLNAKVDPAKQSRPICAQQNTTFEPKVRPDDEMFWKNCPKGIYDPATRGDAPITCVTHCDAVAYCEWAGKRLCGAIGGGPRPSEEGHLALETSEWYQACSQGGMRKYPYGDEYVAGKCGEPGGEPSGTAPVAISDANACRAAEPPFDQIVNMVGNAAEWEDYCRQDIICTNRGGGSNTGLGVGEKGFDCTTAHGSSMQGHIDVGIRCCADYK